MSTPTVRPREDWNNYFLNLAKCVARRSHDLQTQVGCVITREKTIVGTGYNGFMSEVQNNAFPNTRPEKYPFMIHAEANAIARNSRTGGYSFDDCTCYCTHLPCTHCIQLLWQAGIRKIIIPEGSKAMMSQSEEQKKIMEQILRATEGRLSICEIPSSSDLQD